MPSNEPETGAFERTIGIVNDSLHLLTDAVTANYYQDGTHAILDRLVDSGNFFFGIPSQSHDDQSYCYW